MTKNANNLVNYSTINRNLKAKEEIEVSAGFLVPQTGEHYVKVFLWDELDKQNIIMKDAKEIKVAN